jgi:hypothetical protein
MWSKSSITALLHIDIQQQATENAPPAKKTKIIQGNNDAFMKTR